MKKEKAEIISKVKKYGRVQALSQYVNIDTLTGAYKILMQNGVSNVVGAEYGENLNKNFFDLLTRMKNGSYFPQSKDWLGLVDVCERCKKYQMRAFEDRMLQHLFGKILEAIFESKIHRTVADLKKKASTMKSRKLIIIAEAVMEIDLVQFLRQIDQDYFVEFLRQSVADKNFVRYYERFLRSGAKLLAGCTDSESESVVCFLSMMLSICEYYILQLMSSKMKRNFRGLMWVLHDDKSVKFMFEKGMDCKQVYHQLCHEMRKIGLDPIEDKICFWELTSQRKKQMIPHRKPLASANHLNCNLICRGKIRRGRERRQRNEDFY